MSALAVLLAFPAALLGQVLGLDTSMTLHLFLGIGTLFLAYAAFQFDLPRWLAWAGCISATGLGVIFLLQSLTELTQSEALRSIAYGALGQWPEGVLGDLVVAWFLAPLLLASSGRTKQLGLLVVPFVIVVTLVKQLPGESLVEAIPAVVLLLMAFAWFLLASMQGRRETGLQALAASYVSVMSALVIALTPMLASAAPPAAQTSAVATRIDTYLRGRLPTLRIPGLTVVVVEGDQVILSRGYGLADRTAGTPMTEDTPVAIASTSKGMTALAIMQLVEQGLVDLDAPVTHYVSEFTMNDPRASAITVRQVLTHTAGIPVGGFADRAQDDQALERRIAELASIELHFAPGSGYEYANDGYSIAGLVVQRVSGVPYEEYMATHLFEPLGMWRSTFDVARASEWGMAGYGKSRGQVSVGPVPLSRGGNPAGGVLTTGRDVSHYLVALLNDGTFEGAQVITSDSLDRMWTPEPASGVEAYGLGWGELSIAGLRLLSHAGDLAAGPGSGSSGSQFLLAPEHHLGIAVLANMSSLEKAEIAQDTLAIVLGGDPAVRISATDWRQSTFIPDRAVWSTYTGQYQTADGALRVYREGDRLLGEGGGLTMEFVPMSDTQFIMLSDVSTLDEVVVDFERQPDASVVLVLFGHPLAIKK